MRCVTCVGMQERRTRTVAKGWSRRRGAFTAALLKVTLTTPRTHQIQTDMLPHNAIGNLELDSNLHDSNISYSHVEIKRIVQVSAVSTLSIVQQVVQTLNNRNVGELHVQRQIKRTVGVVFRNAIQETSSFWLVVPYFNFRFVHKAIKRKKSGSGVKVHELEVS